MSVEAGQVRSGGCGVEGESAANWAARHWRFALILVTAFGAALRFAWLGRESLWLDEAFSVAQAQKALPSLMRIVAQGEGNPPLYHVLLHFWMAFGKSEVAARSLSALLGTASIPLLCRLGRRLLGPRAGLLAGLLLTVSPLHLYYSQEARMYALFVFLAIASTDAMVSVMRQEGRWRLLVYVVALAAMLYTHYYGVYLLLGQAAFVLFGASASQARRRLLSAQAAAICLFLFWAPVLAGQVIHHQAGWIGKAYGRPGLAMLAAAYASFAVGWEVRRWEVVLAPVLAIVALTGIPGARGDGKRGPLKWAPDMAGSLLAWWLILPVLLPLVVSQVKPSFVPRYVIASFPAAVLLASRGLLRLGQSRRGAAWVLLLLVLGPWAKIDTDFYRLRTKERWRGLVQRLAEQGRAGDIVVFYPAWNKIAYDYYARGRVGLPIYSPPSSLRGLTESEICKSFVSGYSRVWVAERAAGRWYDPGRKLLRCLELRFAPSGRWEYSGVTLRLYSVRGGAAARPQARSPARDTIPPTYASPRAARRLDSSPAP